MNDFLQSKVVQDFKDGKLPVVETVVEFDIPSLAYLGITLLIVGFILLVGKKMLA
ncbi:MAG TPA: hypothetical protein P5243_09920 [Bacteroidales bacterium]|nr:hypothetical protein [Bacteroidales bacterium]HRS19810.1 hypothetical protein [Bacteroidales bacterium]